MRFSVPPHFAGELTPIAEPEFTNSCACRIPPLPALSPLDKGGEGRGEGGFESCAFTNFGNAVGITEGEQFFRARQESPAPARTHSVR
jgi:hypothetical protein